MKLQLQYDFPLQEEFRLEDGETYSKGRHMQLDF
jgi:hypothetical protein